MARSYFSEADSVFVSFSFSNDRVVPVCLGSPFEDYRGLDKEDESPTGKPFFKGAFDRTDIRELPEMLDRAGLKLIRYSLMKKPDKKSPSPRNGLYRMFVRCEFIFVPSDHPSPKDVEGWEGFVEFCETANWRFSGFINPSKGETGIFVSLNFVHRVPTSSRSKRTEQETDFVFHEIRVGDIPLLEIVEF